MHSSGHAMGGETVDFARHRHWRWGLLVAFALSVSLGTLGYHDYLKPASGEGSWRNALYHTAQLFVFHAPHFEQDIPWSLEAARWLAPLTTLLGLFGFGLRLVREEVRCWTLRRIRHHTLVCGLGCKGMTLVRHLRQAGKKVVVIDKDPRPDLAAACARLGALVLPGDATDRGTLAEAGVERAAQIFAVCPEDTVNCEIAAQVSHLLPQKPNLASLECHIHLSDADLREALQKSLRAHPDGGQISLRFLDAFDPEARRLLVEGLPLDHAGIGPDDPRSAHLVLLGFGRLGRTLAVRAAQLGCFANGKRLRISVIDRKAETHRDALLFRHPQIGLVAELQFHQQEASSPRTRELIAGWCADAECVTSVVVCFDNEALALELGLQLAPLLEGNRTRLALRLNSESGLAHLLREAPKTGAAAAQIRIFGLEEQWCELLARDGMASDVFARRIHDEYERISGGTPAEAVVASEAERLKHWLEQPEDFRESSRQQAMHIGLKLRAIGCDLVPKSDPRPAVVEFPAGQLDMLARWEHDRWVAERTVANWRFAPGPKDAVRRTNANLVPWTKLDPKTQDYDRSFIRLIPQLLDSVDLKACLRNR